MLLLHRSARADLLVDALGLEVASPLADPITQEVICVPTRGVERWISQQLSHRVGVCANVAFPFPGSLVGAVVAAASGVDPDADPWSPPRSVWPLVDIVDERVGDPMLGPLTAHLDALTPAGQPRRRWAFLRHVSDLFDRYGVHRPEMIRGWAATDPDPADPDAWQHHLWRLLRDRLGRPAPAERLPDALAAIASGEVELDLPERLSVFGLTRLPPVYLEVLLAVGATRAVHLFLLHPSGGLWDRLAAAGSLGEPAGSVEGPGGSVGAPAGSVGAPAGSVGGPGVVVARRSDPTRLVPANPLLRSWGHDAREMQLVLAAHGVSGGDHLAVPPAGGPVTLLRLIQDGVRDDAAAPGASPAVLAPGDDTLRVYACHGRARQVEILRDALLHRLADDPTLEPRDIIVMCPDIETFAPLIQATFGDAGPAPVGSRGGGPAGFGDGGGAPEGSSRGGVAGGDRGGPPAVRVRLADRALRQTNPLLALASRLLDLAGAKVGASDVLDLVARPVVARRFGFDADELALLDQWVAGSAVRWGLDAGHRSRWGLGGVADGTWQTGLDRLLMGIAVDSTAGVVLDTVPFGDLPSSQVDLAGRLVEVVSRVRLAVARLQGPHPVAGWVDALGAATGSLARPAPDEVWQLTQLHDVLTEAAEEAAAGRPGTAVGLDELRSLLAARLAGRPTRANFRTGDLTFCTLVPMRSVPHRVVALLGLDEGSFPRHAEADGDDLLLRDPRVGEREARSEDRQLLLDALLAARDNLIVTYCGRDDRTNRRLPPCAPVAELLDQVDALAVDADGTPASRRVVVEPPLQAHDPLNFQPLGVGRPGAWGFDPVQRAGAEASLHRSPPRPWLDGPLPAAAASVVPLDALVRFVRHPVKAFLRERLGVHLGERDSDVTDEIPLVLTELDKWAVGDRLLGAVMNGLALDEAVAAEEGRGFLPPAVIRRSPLDGIAATVATLTSRLGELGLSAQPAAGRQIEVVLGDGTIVSGVVPAVRGRQVFDIYYSRLAAKHRLPGWVRLLALTADRPELEFEAVTIGRGPARDTVRVSRMRPSAAPQQQRGRWAAAHLERLVALYRLGLSEPLPLATATSCAWATAVHDQADLKAAMDSAGPAWSSGFSPEQSDPEHVLVWGGRRSFSDLLAEPPGAGEKALAGWPPAERSRFSGLAGYLWEPILGAEELTTR